MAPWLRLHLETVKANRWAHVKDFGSDVSLVKLWASLSCVLKGADLAMMKLHKSGLLMAAQNVTLPPMAALLVSLRGFLSVTKTVIPRVSPIDSKDLPCMSMQHSTTRVQKTSAKMDRQCCSRVRIRRIQSESHHQRIQKHLNRHLFFPRQHSQFCCGCMLVGSTQW